MRTGPMLVAAFLLGAGAGVAGNGASAPVEPPKDGGWCCDGSQLRLVDRTGRTLRVVPTLRCGGLEILGKGLWGGMDKSRTRQNRLAAAWPDGSAALVCEFSILRGAVERGTEPAPTQIASRMLMYDRYGSLAWSRSSVVVSYGLWFGADNHMVVFVTSSAGGGSGCIEGSEGDQYTPGCSEYIVGHRKLGREVWSLGPFSYLYIPVEGYGNQVDISPSRNYLATQITEYEGGVTIGPRSVLVVELGTGRFRRKVWEENLRFFHVLDSGDLSVRDKNGKWTTVPVSASRTNQRSVMIGLPKARAGASDLRPTVQRPSG